MRFLMLNWRDPRNPLAGGAERVTRAFLGGLVQRGHQVDWFTFAFPGGAPEEVLDGIRILRRGGVGSAIVEAVRWTRAQPRYDLVIDQHHGIPWFAPWWCRTRSLAYIHEVLGPVWGAFYRWPMNRFGPFQERWTHWIYRNVPFWVPSASTARALRQHGVRKIAVLENGVDLEPLSSLPPKPASPPIRLIAVSRLAPNKRVDHAIRCLAELHRRGLPAELTVVGEGAETPHLQRLARELGLEDKVRFAGWLSELDKRRALEDHHLLLHPSVREGWGLNVIEANAMGTPAVVYPVDGLVDSTVHERTGYVCARESVGALADGVQWLLEGGDRYRRVREGAWQWAGRFRWNAVIPPVVRHLESLAAGEKLV